MLLDAELLIARAWIEAGEDLNVSVMPGDGDRNAEVPFAVRVADFGRGGGTVCRYRAAPEGALRALREWAERQDVFVSLLGDRYQRKITIYS